MSFGLLQFHERETSFILSRFCEFLRNQGGYFLPLFTSVNLHEDSVLEKGEHK